MSKGLKKLKKHNFVKIYKYYIFSIYVTGNLLLFRRGVLDRFYGVEATLSSCFLPLLINIFI